MRTNELLVSLRFRLQSLVLFAVVPVLGMTLYAAIEDRQRQMSHLQAEAVRMAKAISVEENLLIGGVRELLVALAQHSQARSVDGQTCEAYLAGLKRHLQRYANLGWAAPDGNVYCSAVPVATPVNMGDRSYFQQALSARDFGVGDYQFDRITNQSTISFAYPVLDETDQVRAVVFAALDLDWFNQLQLALWTQLSQGSALINVNRSGVILVHEPDPEQWRRHASTLNRPAISASLRAIFLAGGLLSIGIPAAAE